MRSCSILNIFLKFYKTFKVRRVDNHYNRLLCFRHENVSMITKCWTPQSEIKGFFLHFKSLVRFAIPIRTVVDLYMDTIRWPHQTYSSCMSTHVFHVYTHVHVLTHIPIIVFTFPCGLIYKYYIWTCVLASN